MEWIQVLVIIATLLGVLLPILFSHGKELKDINTRLSRLEGRFEERGYWESRIVQFEGEPRKKKAKGE